MRFIYLIFLSIFFNNSILFALNDKKVKSEEEVKILELKERNLQIKSEIKNSKEITKLELSNLRLDLTHKCNEQGMTDACIKLADSYFNDDNFSKGSKIYKDLCEKNNKDICFQLAQKYSQKSDTVNALKYYEKACKLSDFESCNQLGAIYFKRGKLNQALQVFTANCGNDFVKSCFNLVSLKEKSSSVTDNLNGYWNLCRLKQLKEACERMDQIIKQGNKICFEHQVKYCQEVGAFQFSRLEYLNSSKLYNFACDLGDVLSCYNLGQSYWYLNDLINALKSWKKACELKDDYSCAYVAVINKKNEEFKKIVKMFEDNCLKVDLNSCFQTATLYGFKQDKVNSLKFLKKSIGYGLNDINVFVNLKEFDFLKNDNDFKDLIESTKK